jgi:hypothetical protein
MIAGLEVNGLNSIKTVFDPEFQKLTAELEETGRSLFPGSMSREAYIEKNASRSILFLIDVQKWKNRFFGKNRDFLELDAPEKIAGTFYDFFHAGSDCEKLQVLCKITVGQDFNKTCLKKSTMIAQFLDPSEWGMMDWRTVGILGLSREADLTKETLSPQDFFASVSESTFQRALQALRSCRCRDLPRALDVSLSFFSAGLELWSSDRTSCRWDCLQN